MYHVTGSRAGDGGSRTWIDDARETITTIAAAKGHRLEWTADPPDPRRPGRLRFWRARCADCEKPKSAPELVLPCSPDAPGGEERWLGDDPDIVPAYLTRNCRGLQSPAAPRDASRYWGRTYREKRAALDYLYHRGPHEGETPDQFRQRGRDQLRWETSKDEALLDYYLGRSRQYLDRLSPGPGTL